MKPAKPNPKYSRLWRQTSSTTIVKRFFLAAWMAWFAGSGAAQESELELTFSATERAYLEVLLDRDSYQAGSTVQAAALMTIHPDWHTNSHTPTYDYLIGTDLSVGVLADWEPAELHFPEGHMSSFAFADEPLSVYQGEALIYADIAVPEGVSGEVTIPFMLTYQACDDRSCLAPVTTESIVRLKVGAKGEAQNQAFFDNKAEMAPASSASKSGPSVAWMFLFGLLGGLILNAMPCVLPVLSLKIFSLIRDSDQGSSVVRRGSFATAGGILISFWALALVAIMARSAGRAVGWGVQFQEPLFVAALALVVILFCLNLWGLFEIILPSSLVTKMGSTESKHGLGGHFASGLFTTLMATPCSAPFLGTAVGFALAQPSAIILTIFTAVGLGMALPYLALLIAPGLARFLPKPGAWMEQLKIAMGFLLAAAAVWLFYVLANQIPRASLAAFQLALLGVAGAIWAASRVRGKARMLPWAAAVIAGAIGLMVTGGAQAPVAASETQHHLTWETFDETRIDTLLEQHQPVFVDVTADWCFTCKVNERLVLETETMAAVFAERGVVAMKADWTSRDDTIADYLARHGRYSVPTYVLYLPGQEPFLFSELLTQDALIEKLES